MSAESLRWADRIETRMDRLTSLISWVWLALIALIVLTVVLRYAFGSGRIELEELEWHLYAIGFLMGIAACASHDRHVRVDVFRERMMPRTRAWIDLYGILLLQIPFLALVLWSAAPFVADSFAVGERSSAAGGLPYRWILKAFLPISVLLLSAATGARLIRVLDLLFGGSTSSGPR